ncbi:hypothetical protein QAD02_023932 [Eretmocerus hayati]|uniref:Uncharacterized protein n=1 Tax=Eretmocerus hayati TaxID=131215 RepID=A0ACC2Q0N8_9HYME|nr:hypothetical protein QAD02_023932 [Eretmocerus hayati]
MSSSESELEEGLEIVPQEIRDKPKDITFNLLPPKSKQTYVATYNAFKKCWRSMNSNSFCEDVLLNYFEILSKQYADPSLWAYHSMLKSTISAFNNIDIGKYKRLPAFIKRVNEGYTKKKSEVFTKAEISRFLSLAPNDTFLFKKVALIFGVAGALRREEFTKVEMCHITDGVDSEGNPYLLIKILKTKNKIPRSFVINDYQLYNLCKLYMKSRPEGCTETRFFLRYSDGKCCNQAVGINTFGKLPRQIAEYLKLPNAAGFTGHALRRTSATLFIDSSGDITALKRHGGWKSNTTAEGYLADSYSSKSDICQKICSGIIINDSNCTSARLPTNPRKNVGPKSSAGPSTSDKNLKVCSNQLRNDVQNIQALPIISQKVQLVQKLDHMNLKQSGFPNEIENLIQEAEIIFDGETNLDLVSQEVNLSTGSPTRTPSQSTRSPTRVPLQSMIQPDRFQGNIHITRKRNITSETICAPHSPKQQIITTERKVPVHYHPDIGLYVEEDIVSFSNNPIVFNNCHVVIDGSYNSHVFNNCTISDAAQQPKD